MNNFNHELIQQLPGGIICFNMDGAISFINIPLLKKLGYSQEELLNKHIETLFTLSSRIFYQTHLFPLIKLHGEANEIFMMLRSKSKEDVPVLLNVCVSKQDAVETIICNCIWVYNRRKYEDEILAAKKQAEDALLKNEELQKVKKELEHESRKLDEQLSQQQYRNKELQQFNKILSHDLQEPVRKISLFADMILRDKGNTLSTQSTNSFKAAMRSAQRSQELLRRLQDYMGLDMEDMVWENIKLQEVLEEAIAKVKKEFADVDAVVEIDPIIATTRGDSKQLCLLFYHLISNAFQFRSPERDLVINISNSTFEDNAYVTNKTKYKYIDFVKIIIDDNGLGFNELMKDHLFDLLKKTDLNGTGLGFGLAICKRITENHGGTITAFGNEKKGAKFVIILPAFATV